MVLIPESARRRPTTTMVFAYRVVSPSLPIDAEDRLREAVTGSGLDLKPGPGPPWRLSLPHTTRVYGIIGREVDESVELRLSTSHDGPTLVLSCRPDESHAAHAAGLAGVLVVAATLWLVGGLTGGILPAVTAIVAGWLVVEVTRQWAMDALERRLRALADGIGGAVWPGAPAEIRHRNFENES